MSASAEQEISVISGEYHCAENRWRKMKESVEDYFPHLCFIRAGDKLDISDSKITTMIAGRNIYCKWKYYRPRSHLAFGIQEKSPSGTLYEHQPCFNLYYDTAGNCFTTPTGGDKITYSVTQYQFGSTTFWEYIKRTLVKDVEIKVVESATQ
jgi:hypothetical protein